MGRPTLALLLVLVASATGCGGLSTEWTFDPGYDFARLHTYDWKGIRAATDKFVEKRIAAETDRQLRDKGFLKTDQHPDFRIVVYFNVTAESVTTLAPDFSELPPGWVGGIENPTQDAYRGGSVMMEFHDGRSKELIWRGIVSGTVKPRTPQEKRAKIIDSAVDALLANFPPAKPEK